MITIVNKKIFIDDVQVTDPEMIGYALLDFAETIEDDDSFSIVLVEKDVFVDKKSA